MIMNFCEQVVILIISHRKDSWSVKDIVSCMITFLIGSFLMKDITSSTVEGMMYWPFGLFMSEHTLASIILGAIPTKMKTSKCYIKSLCNSIF